MFTPVNHLGGKCPCIPFFTGGQMSVGGNVLHSFNQQFVTPSKRLCLLIYCKLIFILFVVTQIEY